MTCQSDCVKFRLEARLSIFYPCVCEPSFFILKIRNIRCLSINRFINTYHSSSYVIFSHREACCWAVACLKSGPCLPRLIDSSSPSCVSQTSANTGRGNGGTPTKLLASQTMYIAFTESRYSSTKPGFPHPIPLFLVSFLAQDVASGSRTGESKRMLQTGEA